MSEPWLEKAIARAQKEVDRLTAAARAQDDPTHEHEWWLLDGTRHCFGCQRTEHEPYADALVVPAPQEPQ